MLSCKQVAMRADALLDGELGAFDRLQMRIHLLMCKGCAAFMAQMQTIRRLSDDAIARGGEVSEADEQIAEILRNAFDDNAPERSTTARKGQQ